MKQLQAEKCTLLPTIEIIVGSESKLQKSRRKASLLLDSHISVWFTQRRSIPTFQWCEIGFYLMCHLHTNFIIEQLPMVITTQSLYQMSFLFAVILITPFWLVYAMYWFSYKGNFCLFSAEKWVLFSAFWTSLEDNRRKDWHVRMYSE